MNQKMTQKNFTMEVTPDALQPIQAAPMPAQVANEAAIDAA